MSDSEKIVFDTYNYPPGHQFTVVQCEYCGAYYEPFGKEHVCKGLQKRWKVTRDFDILESILIGCYGCKKPFLDEAKVVVEDDGTSRNERLTKAGSKAYAKLVETIYALEKMGVIRDANGIVESLDGTVRDQQY